MTYGHHEGDSPFRPRPTVRNMAWPFHDRTGNHARGIPDQEHPIEVDVRLELDDNGTITERWEPGLATRWTRTHVYVTRLPAELHVPGVWVVAGDVRRQR